MILSILDIKLILTLIHTWHIHQSHKHPLPTCTSTGILEEVGIEYPSIVIKKEHLTSKLFNYFVLCSVYSNNFSNP